MIKEVKAYKNTSVHWTKSQAEIQKLLEKQGIKETRFTTLERETMQQAGIDMESESAAIMIEFFKSVTLADGVAGRVPIRIVVPNIPAEEKYKNQAYRILHWYLKTKFEAVETGLIEFEQEFMPHIALGKGGGIGTVWQMFKEKMLPLITSGKESDIRMLETNRAEKIEHE